MLGPVELAALGALHREGVAAEECPLAADAGGEPERMQKRLLCRGVAQLQPRRALPERAAGVLQAERDRAVLVLAAARERVDALEGGAEAPAGCQRPQVSQTDRRFGIASRDRIVDAVFRKEPRVLHVFGVDAEDGGVLALLLVQPVRTGE